MMKFKSGILFLIFNYLFSCYCISQKTEIISNDSVFNTKTTFYKFYNKHDKNINSIEFAFIGDLKNKKPTLFYIEGSGLSSSFIRDSTGNVFYTSFQAINLFLQNYNILIPSKFGIPICPNEVQLNSDFEYLPNDRLPIDYVKNSTLENYVEVYNQIINFIAKKSKNKLFTVMGHSQGARIALNIMTNKNVREGVYMSADPLGRFASIIDQEYSSFKNRNQDRIDFYFSLLSCDSCREDSLFRNETINSWQSFSMPSILLLTDIKKPLLITYGDMDLSCPNCYIFDVMAFSNEKLFVKKYLGADHNYFIDNKKHIDKVYNDIIKWLSSSK